MQPDAIDIPRFEYSRIPNEPAATTGAWAVLGRLAGGAGRWLLAAMRSSRTDLSDFSDAQLRDIGLTRIDVELPSSAVRPTFRQST